MNDTNLLRQIVEQYHLNLNGVACPTPYWINWDVPPYYKGAPYRGKGSGRQIAGLARRRLKAESEPPRTAEDMRRWLRRQGLGVDCSGFAYHVLSDYMRRVRGERLSSHLRVSRAEIAAALRRHPDRADPLEGRPDVAWVSLAEACRYWHKDPAMITNVRRLTDPAVCIRVERARDIRPADLIKTTTEYGDHVAVVYAVTADTIDYVASEDDSSGFGGIRFRTVHIAQPDKGLEAQSWDQSRIYRPGEHGDGVWRLRVL
jgi:hypothetical protein